MTSNTLWKKQAAQVLDDSQAEQAFMDQAYTFVANKAGPLMDPPFRLGFEVVTTNDDHTRMVGMFAFRVNRRLLSAPVFFINGQIKGTDLLYDHSSKLFKPLTKKWATYMVSSYQGNIGRGMDTKDIGHGGADIELDDLASPPGTYSYQSKHASVFNAAADLFKHYEPPSGDLRSPLRGFIAGDGGIPAFRKLAAAMAGSKEFAELVAKYIPEDDYMPSELLDRVKSAAAPRPAHPLRIIKDIAHLPSGDGEKSASAREEFFNRGYFLWDDRAPGDLQPATKQLEIELCRPGEPGVYKILCDDGELREAIVARPSEQRFSCGDEHLFATHPDSWKGVEWDDDQPPELVIVMEGDGSTGTFRNPRGEYVKNLSDSIREGELATAMSAGSSYRVYDPEGGVLSEPVHCVSKKDENGITVYEVVREHGSEPISLRHNPDEDQTSFSANFLGSDVFFIPVSAEKDVDKEYDTYDGKTRYYWGAKRLKGVGDDKALDRWILSHGVKSAGLIKDPSGAPLFSFRAGRLRQTPYAPREKVACLLAGRLGLHASSAESLLDEASEKGSCEFYVGGPGFEKFAAPMRVVDEANFDTSYDPAFDVQVDYPQAFALDTATGGVPEPPERRIGDAYDPGMGVRSDDGQSLSEDTLLNSLPEDLPGLKELAGVPHVMGHGIMGSLIKTFNSVSMIDKYVPDLETALDRLGRLLFLMYWKPRDFEDAYGADDMSNMENQILSAFQSFGDLVLDLIQKNEYRSDDRRGNVS